MSEPLFQARRNGVVERLERGHCVLSDARGSVLWAVGDPDHVTYLRSSAKPMQVTALLLSGAVDKFGLEAAHIAVACGSHHGEPRHVHTVSDLLRRAGVGPEMLQCGAHDLAAPIAYPLARAGLHPSPLHNNCSGKHAGMLTAAHALGAPLATYLEPGHPVQTRILQSVSACASLSPDQIVVGTDGCSAPNFALSMRRIARCFAQIADPSGLDAELATALMTAGAAMRADPWLVSGADSLDTALMGALPTTVISKGGAEGLQCLALPAHGLGLAVKFESGRAEGIGAVVLAILRGLGLISRPLPPPLARFDAPSVRNHRGLVVGDTRSLVDLAAAPQLTATPANV
ncbi:MAG TPA: asparaginase [Chloroflexota bacterium]|nr:asparaginase [Chloroflexota bacterium]